MGNSPNPHFFVSSSPAECDVLEEKAPQPADVSHAMHAVFHVLLPPLGAASLGVERS